MPADTPSLADAARALSDAERDYRAKHDLLGFDNIEAGRAWDVMRRAGDALRAALKRHDAAKAEADRVLALGADEEGCCRGCGREVPPSPCCPDYPVWPGPCRFCYSDMGTAGGRDGR